MSRVGETRERGMAVLMTVDRAEVDRGNPPAGNDPASHLRFLGDHIPGGMIYQLLMEPGGGRRFLYVSAGVSRLHGHAAEDVLGDVRLLYEDIHPGDRERLAAAEVEAARTMTPFACEARVRGADGCYRWSYLTSEPMARPDGAILWNGLELDITERKRAEGALRESERQLNEAQRLAGLGSWELDLAHDRLTWSDEIYRFFEIDRERFGASYEAFLDAIHPEDRAAVNEAYRTSLERMIPYAMTHRLLMKDGRIKFVEERCETTFDASGRPLVSRGTVQDITERKTASDALAEALAFRNQVIQSARDGIIVYDRDLRYRVWNPAMERISEVCAHEVLGRRPEEVFPFLGPVGVLQRLHCCLAGETPDLIEFPVPLPSGRFSWATDASSPLWDHEGRVIGVIGIVRETTAQHEAEEALVRSERLAAVGKLASGVAHEFNNILAIVRIETQLLAMDPALEGKTTAEERLATIEEQTERGSRVASGIMAIARPTPPQLARERVADLVDRVLAVQRTALAGENIEVRVEVPGDLEVLADGGRIQQVLLNLVLNARDAMRPQGRGVVSMAAVRDENAREVRLRIADSGVGMSRDILDRLFTPFFSTKGAFGGPFGSRGNGLGLAVSYTILQEHGGRIAVESEPGHGAAFTLIFPCPERVLGDATMRGES